MLKTLLIKFIGANRQKNYEKLTKYIESKNWYWIGNFFWISEYVIAAANGEIAIICSCTQEQLKCEKHFNVNI